MRGVFHAHYVRHESAHECRHHEYEVVFSARGFQVTAGLAGDALPRFILHKFADPQNGDGRQAAPVREREFVRVFVGRFSELVLAVESERIAEQILHVFRP